MVWTNTWGTPELGFYRSDSNLILKRHAAVIAEASVDFILIDWSNNLGSDHRAGKGSADQIFVEHATTILFETWSSLSNSPQVSFLLGIPLDPAATTNGQLQLKADQIFEEFISVSQYMNLINLYLGKPLLVIYVNTPSPFTDGVPIWKDERFTVRWMTGFVSNQGNLLGSNRLSRYGYWSWEDRDLPTVSVYKGHPETVTVTASWRDGSGENSSGRKGGETYLTSWAYARLIGPAIVLAGTFNEWKVGEQPTASVSKDVEPSLEFGHFYTQLLREQALLFKQGL